MMDDLHPANGSGDAPFCPTDLFPGQDDRNDSLSNYTEGGLRCTERSFDDGGRHSEPFYEPPTGPWNMTVPEYAIPINGYISPILVFLTIVNNSLVCLVLLKKHMRSPTNTLLVAMAISDMLTGVFPLPIFMHFFATRRFWEWIPYEWCLAYRFLNEFVPTIFHTASIWLTMALAVQRYIYVCHSFRARAWCTIENAIRGTVLIYVLATLCHLCRFVDAFPVAQELESRLQPNVSVTTCVMVFHGWIAARKNLYFNVYFWFRVIFIHLVPCVSLVAMNALLIYAMKMAQKRRQLLLKQNKRSESKKLKDSNCTTLMLVAVVGLFLLVEFPLGILFIIMIVSNTFGITILEVRTFQVLSLFSNFFILLSYPLNFFIYCGMSKQFRQTFKRLFTGSSVPMDREYSQYQTLPTENGKTAVTGDETAL